MLKRDEFSESVINPQLATWPGLWQTVGMTNQQRVPQHREDYKVQKLVQRIEKKLVLQAKAQREANLGTATN
jgi:hypothetical protein